MRIGGYSNLLGNNNAFWKNNASKAKNIDLENKANTSEKEIIITQNTDEVQNSKTNKSSLIPDWIREEIKVMAKEDFDNGIYMDIGFRRMRMSYMKENISPDREAVIAKVTPIINKAKPLDNFELLLSMIGIKNYRATVSVGSFGDKYVHLYNENGEEIGGYSPSSGWVSTSTKAEIAFYDTMSGLYASAWDKAKIQQENTATLDVMG